jgi:hypothetical protein
MNLQYITDSNGLTTGVFIPIKEWNDIKTKFKDIDKQEVEVPDWHKEIVHKRMDSYKSNPGQALDFDASMDEIEKGL